MMAAWRLHVGCMKAAQPLPIGCILDVWIAKILVEKITPLTRTVHWPYVGLTASLWSLMKAAGEIWDFLGLSEAWYAQWPHTWGSLRQSMWLSCTWCVAFIKSGLTWADDCSGIKFGKLMISLSVHRQWRINLLSTDHPFRTLSMNSAMLSASIHEHPWPVH